MDRALMKRLAIKVLAVLTATGLGFSHAELPKFSQDKAVSVLQYNGDHEVHLFYSDKTYCYIWAYHGYAIVGGKWSYQNSHEIQVKPNPPGKEFFGYWDYTENATDNQKILISSVMTKDQDKLLLGFGNEQPDTLSWYDPQTDDMTQPIPQNANYVFLGNGKKTPAGDYQLMRFALTPKPNEKDKFFNYILAKDWEGMPEDMLKEFNPHYKIKNNQLVFYHAEFQTPLDSKSAKKFRLNVPNEGGELANNAYDYCKTGHGMAHFKPEYPLGKFLAPTMLSWQGTPLADNWQKEQKREF